ncbi:transmembrane protein 241 isoform X2 [Cynoglossus semilaevis]|uniref:transmembrane protein 241 isoform X2 n=1 Tax=Cynoglossus semilaevis TaxID=244447 RepID=UPI000D62A1F3|nr:transmembrane protein 241 isoform X2 [Cynoglossus semilaevis]
MQWKKYTSGCVFIFLFVLTYFTNKFVLSVLKFTYPTLFQGWQTFIGALLLLLFGKLGWVEMSRINRTAALPWLPASLIFVGNIYAGSRALSRLNSSHVVSHTILKVAHREKIHWLKLLSLFLMLISAVNLPYCDLQFELNGYLWAVVHLVCVGAYRVFKSHYKPSNLSDLEQQCIDYLFSVLLLAVASHPTGDLLGVLEFPSLQSHTFHCGCCASALLGFLLLLATSKLKTGLSLEHFRIWSFLSKITAICFSPFVFSVKMNAPSVMCVVVSHVGEALLLYTDREPQL